MIAKATPTILVILTLALISLVGCSPRSTISTITSTLAVDDQIATLVQATLAATGAAAPTDSLTGSQKPTQDSAGSTLASPTASSTRAAATSGPTLTPWPTHTRPAGSMVTATLSSCPGAPVFRLAAGMRATVSQNPPIPSRVREQPSLQGKLVGQIEPGEVVTVLEGPRCADNYAWWKVQSAKGLMGWTVEGDKRNYWLVPKTSP
jgi:Bacterial SH3 domain